jgi:hypothetical protein
MSDPPRARTRFWLLWGALLAAKLVLAARLPAFGDEAFYWWESRHPAWAYSDLPGLTAWLIGRGTTLAGHTPFGMRWPFLLIGAACPLLVVRIARHWGDPALGWRAGSWSLLLPLFAALGVLALPDVPLTLAGLLCVDALASLHRRPGAAAAAQLAVGLALGALAHYRFVLLLGAGGLWLLLDPRGRALLRDWRVWAALLFGLLAWWPLLRFNLEHGGAGLRFQLLERHPWAPHIEGLAQPLVQALVVTPILYALLLAVLVHAWRRRGEAAGPWRLVLGTSGTLLLGLWLSAVFTDAERVSFHWPLLAYLPLVALLPAWLDGRGTRWLPQLAGAVAALGTLALFGWLAATTSQAGRAWLDRGPLYPDNFGGWERAHAEAFRRLQRDETVLVADNFMLGAQLALGFEGRREVYSLSHPLNTKHGRALQLSLWGRDAASLAAANPDAPRLVMIEDGALRGRERLDWYRTLCAQVGELGPLTTAWADGGAKRFLSAMADPHGQGACVLPALAWIDAPAPGVRIDRPTAVRGWAFKDGAGVAEVWITLDGRPHLHARYGLPAPHVASFWKVSTDPAHPAVGFEALLDPSGIAAGEHRMGLLVLGKDGSREEIALQRITVVR